MVRYEFDPVTIINHIHKNACFLSISSHFSSLFSFHKRGTVCGRLVLIHLAGLSPTIPLFFSILCAYQLPYDSSVGRHGSCPGFDAPSSCWMMFRCLMWAGSATHTATSGARISTLPTIPHIAMPLPSHTDTPFVLFGFEVSFLNLPPS